MRAYRSRRVIASITAEAAPDGRDDLVRPVFRIRLHVHLPAHVLFVAGGSRVDTSFADPLSFSIRKGFDMNDELEIIANLLLLVALGAAIALWYLLAQVFRDSP